MLKVKGNFHCCPGTLQVGDPLSLKGGLPIAVQVHYSCRFTGNMSTLNRSFPLLASYTTGKDTLQEYRE